MTTEVAKKFLKAVETAGITSYELDTDIGTHLYNNPDTAIVKFDEATSSVVNLTDSRYGGSHNTYNGHIRAVVAHTDDIHEARIGGNRAQISSFLKAYGITLSDDELKLLITIDNSNVDIKPATGDYNRFKPLTKKQYDELSPEEKKAYDAAKEAEEKRQHDYIGQNSAASITLY